MMVARENSMETRCLLYSSEVSCRGMMHRDCRKWNFLIIRSSICIHLESQFPMEKHLKGSVSKKSSS